MKSGWGLRSLLGGAITLVALLLSAAAVVAQGSGQLHISVKDPTGAGMIASGRLENLSTGSIEPFQTDALGAYAVTNLSNARYRVEISKPGFTTQTALADVRSGNAANVTVTMSLSAQATKVD